MSEFNLIPGDANHALRGLKIAGQTFHPAYDHILEWVDLDLRLGSFVTSISICVYFANGAHEPFGDVLTRDRFIVDKPWNAMAMNRVRYSMAPYLLTEGEYYAIVIRATISPFEPDVLWRYKTTPSTYPSGHRIWSNDGGGSWTHEWDEDFIFGEFGTPPSPAPPPEPPIFKNMPVEIEQIPIEDGFKIIYTTNVPCHCYMRWTLKRPVKHIKPIFLRGYPIWSDLRQCFVSYHDNEQEEAGDTLIHTFIKINWPVCQIRYFFFWSKCFETNVVSTSAIFTKHRTLLPTVNYLPCWHNRLMDSSSGNWTTCRNGAALGKHGVYQRPDSFLVVTTSLIGLYRIYRSFINFDTTGMGAAVAARLGIYVTGLPTHHFDLILTKGLYREPVVDTDWLPQTPETTILGQLNTSAMTLNQYNWIPLNATGIAWLNSSFAEHKQHESFDWRKNAYWPVYTTRRASQNFTPQTSHAITRMKVRIRRRGSGGGNTRCELYLAGPNGCPTGPYLARDTVVPASISPAVWGDWYEFSFAPVAVTAGTTYCVVLYNLGGNSSNCTYWIAAGGTTYQNGHCCYSTNGGASWTPYTAYALYFIEYEELLEGQTNFVLKTSADNSDSPPGAGALFSIAFHSAQEGIGFYPILEVTT